MRDDNTPTVTSRRRKPTPHQRLRLDKAKELKKQGALTKKKRDESKKQDPGETDPKSVVSSAPRIPKLKQDTLSKPAKPAARFRKRQIHKSWLPTHLYHAKRAKMSPPQEPLWRFAIPLTPTNKCYRTTHGAASSRGCVAWDSSYMGTIGVEGVETSLLGLLRSIGLEEGLLVGKRHAKWRRGTRDWQGWIRERDGENIWIAKVGVMWCMDDTPTESPNTNDLLREASKKPEARPQSEHTEQLGTEAVCNQVVKPRTKSKRRLLIRVHPSAFLQVWNEVLKVAKIQRPAAMVEDLRFEIGSIEIIGPESTEALIGALHPMDPSASAEETTGETNADDEWIDLDAPEKVWPQLAAITNPASLPANAILGFSVSDPRLDHPPRTVQRHKAATDHDALLELISSWPPDQTQTTPDIFVRNKRLIASRQLASQKSINRRKSEALPGTYPLPSPKDPKIPILLMASRSPTTAGQGLWTLLLPWDCVLPVWYSIMHYPLTSGGSPRFGGLQERRQISFENGDPWYPADFPGTKAGYEWELLGREKRKQEWEKRPKGKRTAWESVDLGDGKKGEIGMGWACDWERLFQGPLPLKAGGEPNATSEHSAKAAPKGVLDKGKTNVTSTSSSGHEQPQTETLTPPLSIHYLPTPLPMTAPIPPGALTPVHLTLLTTGHPTRNARIYRLPSTNNQLRARWVALALPPNSSKHPRQARPGPSFPKGAAPHERAQGLAASLLAPSLSTLAAGTGSIGAGHPAYPCAPDEIDLIGFVTTGNYHLGQGKCEAIGNVAVAKVIGEDIRKGKGGEKNLCIVRESGQSVGRLARWEFV